jgi:hypothetical protein
MLADAEDGIGKYSRNYINQGDICKWRRIPEERKRSAASKIRFTIIYPMRTTSEQYNFSRLGLFL